MLKFADLIFRLGYAMLINNILNQFKPTEIAPLQGQPDRIGQRLR